MHNYKYMFVNYEKTFPVYVSVQNNRDCLVVPHFHEDMEILKITDGKVLVYVGKEVLECYKGDILLFFPNTLHQVRRISKNAEVTAISYSNELQGSKVDYTPAKSGFHIFGNTDPCYPRLNETFLKAIKVFHQKSYAYKLEMTACILELTAIFLNQGLATFEQTNRPKNRLESALQYIEQNLGAQIKISDLTEILNLSKEQVIRIFKTTTGKTPTEYITDLKIKRAIALLSDDALSITEISENLGFSNPSHFSKAFKKCIKLTPSQYRVNIKTDKA